ncbi:hypothetical protein, partial [Klebsiella pneumoniae]|uniref:hypothetical protein n=1 Tax=Klebsiella pneumoniae TaxID=573 RepID=UPI003EBED0D8
LILKSLYDVINSGKGLLSIVIAAIFDKMLECQVYFLLVTTQGPSKQNLIQMGTVVSEEKIKVYGQMDRQTNTCMHIQLTMSFGHMG